MVNNLEAVLYEMKSGRAVPFESAATFAKGQSPAEIYAY